MEHADFLLVLIKFSLTVDDRQKIPCLFILPLSPNSSQIPPFERNNTDDSKLRFKFAKKITMKEAIYRFIESYFNKGLINKTRSTKMTQKEEIISIGIIGGGKGGHSIYEILDKSTLTSIAFVCDVNHDAPTMKLARKNGIPTCTDMDEALRIPGVPFIIEATGSPKVREIVEKAKMENVELVTSQTALLLFKISSARAEVNGEIARDIKEIKNEINNSLGSINNSLEGIKKIAVDLNMLALNARIEAAHAGKFGQGFSVVAEEVKTSATQMQKMAEDISEINDKISDVSGNIDKSLVKMQ